MRLLAGHGRELELEQRGDLAREAVDRQQVGPVARDLDLEDVLRERKHVRERRPRFVRLLEDEDPGVVLPELELALGEDHPAGALAAEGRLAERRVGPGEERAGQRHGDRRAGAEVPRAADDLARLALPHVDPAELQAVGVRVLAGLDDAPDEKVLEVAVGVGDAAPRDPLDLDGRDGEPVGERAQRHVEGDVLAQPRDRDLHQNWPRTRRSFAQSRRMSGSPCRRSAIRSSPSPKAKPDTFSGSYAFGSTNS